MTTPLIRSAAEHFLVDPADIVGNSRALRHVWARNAVAYVMRHRDYASSPAIGRRLNRDHSTVLHGIARAEQRIASDPRYAGIVTALMERRPRPVPVFVPAAPQIERIEMTSDSPLILDEDGMDSNELTFRLGMIDGSERLAEAIFDELRLTAFRARRDRVLSTIQQGAAAC